MSAKKSDGTAVPQSAAQAAPSGGVKPTYQASPKSTYPTDEERAKTQIYIVRQSNITAAINLLSTGAKAPPKLDDIIATAKVFENHVFGTSTDSVDVAKPAVGHEFDDLDDMPQ